MGVAKSTEDEEVEKRKNSEKKEEKCNEMYDLRMIVCMK